MHPLLDPSNYAFNLTGIGYLTVGVINLMVGIHIFRKGNRIVHVAYFMTLLAISVWLFGNGFFVFMKSDVLINKVYMLMVNLGLILVGAGNYFCAVTISGEFEKKRNKILAGYLVGIFLYILTQLFSELFILEPYNYFFGPVVQAGPAYPIFLIFFAFMATMGFITIFNIPKEKLKKDDNLRKLRKIYILSNIWGYSASIDYLLIYGVEMYPPGYFIITIVFIILAYGILKYDLFKMTPKLVAENIVATMKDYLIAFDKNYKIEVISTSLVKALKSDVDTLTGKDVKFIFKDEIRSIMQELENNKEITNLNVNIQLKDRVLPVLVSGSQYKMENGKLWGYVLIMKDLSEVNTLVKDVQIKSSELQDKIKELKRANKIMVNRELKMIELKERVEKLEETNLELRNVRNNE